MKEEIGFVIAVAAAIYFAARWALERMINTALIHMMLENGMHVDEREYRRHFEECLKRRFKRSGSRGC